MCFLYIFYWIKTDRRVHELLLLIAYMHKHPLNAQAVRDLKFGLSRYQHPYFEYTSNKGSGECKHMHGLV